MTLYEINTAIRQIIECSPDGELSETDIVAIDTLAISLEEKADGYCALYREWTAEADAIKAEGQRLLERAESRHKAAARLKERLRLTLADLDMQKIKTARFTAYRQGNPPSVVLDIPTASLPEQFQRKKTIIDPDKQAILAHAESGGELPNGVSIIRGEHLRIK